MPDLGSLQANIRRVAFAILLGFVVIAFALGYWQLGRTDLASDGGNPRIVEQRLYAPRGRILDRAGQVLAQSEETPRGMRRRYAAASLVHSVGLHSPRFGDTNVEALYDAQLRGERTTSAWDRLLAELFHRQPRPDDVVMAIDKRIHDAALAALGDADGAVVALDPRTGAVLALVAKPFVDPNLPEEELAKQQAAADGGGLFNRAIQATYVPGSTFKAITAAAAVDLNLIDLDQPFTCTTPVRIGTYPIDCRNSQHVPRLNFAQAFAWSSNRVFGLTGLLLGAPGPLNPWLSDTPPGPYPWERGGIGESARRVEQYAGRFGFERAIPFDLPVTPSRLKHAPEWNPQLLAQTAFGQGEVQATPMQMALVAAAIANQGRVPTPYLVEQVRAAGGATVRPHRAGDSFSTATSPRTAQVLVDFMVEGVARGYGEKAGIPGVKVGGKTGTAELGDGTSHSWFIGFAPAEDPLVAVAVIMERKGSGADFATPAARRVIQTALEVYQR